MYRNKLSKTEKNIHEKNKLIPLSRLVLFSNPLGCSVDCWKFFKCWSRLTNKWQFSLNHNPNTEPPIGTKEPNERDPDDDKRKQQNQRVRLDVSLNETRAKRSKQRRRKENKRKNSPNILSCLRQRPESRSCRCKNRARRIEIVSQHIYQEERRKKKETNANQFMEKQKGTRIKITSPAA